MNLYFTTTKPENNHIKKRFHAQCCNSLIICLKNSSCLSWHTHYIRCLSVMKMTVIFLSTHVADPMLSFVDNLSKATVVFLAHIFTDTNDVIREKGSYLSYDTCRLNVVIYCLHVMRKTVILLSTHVSEPMMSFTVYLS